MGFQKGQKIRAIRAAQSAYGHKFAPGDEVVVTDPSMTARPNSHPHHRLGVNTAKGAAESGGDTSEWVVNPADFELVELDPSKVKAGDTVTLERDGGKVSGPVATVTFAYHQRAFVIAGGLQVQFEGPSAWTLTAHQPAPEPKPLPPTASGSFVLANGLVGLPKVPMFLTQHGWVTRYGSKMGWTVEVLQSRGFEVIHDAGKGAS